MKIGLSLSFCVRDIALGVVDEHDVARIIASTCSEDLEPVLKQYQNIYWKNVPGALDIARRLIDQGLVYQPRLHGQYPINICLGHWAEIGHLHETE